MLFVWTATYQTCLKRACAPRLLSGWYQLFHHSRPQRLRSFWLADGDRDLWPCPTPEVRDSRTSRYSAHALSQVWQIWLVLVSIYCVYKAIQNQNVVGPGQRSWFSVLTKRIAASGDENVLANEARFFQILGIFRGMLFPKRSRWPPSFLPFRQK